MRSFGYALVATVLCLLLAFPLAYVIAFKAGRYKNLILGSGDPAVLRDVPDPHHRVEDDPRRRGLGGQRAGRHRPAARRGRLLSTSWAVIGGLTYNWIIFMILPLYVSLEKIDPRLLEASKDLYSSNAAQLPKGDSAAVDARRAGRQHAGVHPRRR